jgi:dTDP-4-dehydrorhamnose reductase
VKILLLGAGGQLGRQLRRSLAPLGTLQALERGSEVPCGDLRRHEALAATVRAFAPDAIVNAGAWTDVDGAESDPDGALAVNGAACEVLAREAAALGAWLVHYSSDYVFDGSGRQPWRESDPTEPLNAYGRSKLAGEQAIARHGGKHLVLRTSWLFETWGDNFVKTVLAAARRGDRLGLVNDQWGAPTRAAHVADVTAHLLRCAQPAQSGIYHLSAAGETSWHGVALHVLACARADGLTLKTREADVQPIASAELQRRAPRPANSRLDNGKLRDTFGLALPDWREGVSAVVAELAHVWGLQ